MAGDREASDDGGLDTERESQPSMEAFHWRETHKRLRTLLEGHTLQHDPRVRGFVAEEGRIRITLPFALGSFADTSSPEACLATLPKRLGLCALVLVQAGASGLGLWRDDELLEHKAIKKYVVRGRGRAQPLQLKSRGKSRYGSRLRLQNALRQLEETNEKLRDWVERHGAFERVFYSCPVRTWPELFRVTPPPPFEQRGEARKIPMDVHVPDFAEVQRIWQAMTHGRSFSE